MVYKDEKPDECSDILEWADNNYFKLTNPFNIERHYWLPSWLVYYSGDHPAQVINMMRDVKSGEVKIELRNNSDVEKILGKKMYSVKTNLMKVYNGWDYYSKLLVFQLSRIKNIPGRIRRNLKSIKSK
jgi:hypothetical protein